METTTRLPADLQPRWRDTPRLAWLATRRLCWRAPGPPVVGTLMCLAAVLPMYTVLAAFRLEGRLAAHSTAAVMTVTPIWPRRPARLALQRTALYGIGAALNVMPPSLLAIAGIAAIDRGAVKIGQVVAYTSIAALAVISALAVAAFAPAMHSAAPRQRRRARVWARRNDLTLVEAGHLAAEKTDHRAATILVRKLLTAADRAGITVTAYPRNDEVAAMYTAIGFKPFTGGRLLVRQATPVKSSTPDHIRS